MRQRFWTVRKMALVGAILFGVYGFYDVHEQLSLGGHPAASAIGQLVAYLVIGAIVGALLAIFLGAKE